MFAAQEKCTKAKAYAWTPTDQLAKAEACIALLTASPSKLESWTSHWLLSLGGRGLLVFNTNPFLLLPDIHNQLQSSWMEPTCATQSLTAQCRGAQQIGPKKLGSTPLLDWMVCLKGMSKEDYDILVQMAPFLGKIAEGAAFLDASNYVHRKLLWKRSSIGFTCFSVWLALHCLEAINILCGGVGKRFFLSFTICLRPAKALTCAFQLQQRETEPVVSYLDCFAELMLHLP